MRGAVWLLGLVWRAGVRVARRARFAWVTGPGRPRVAFDELGGRLDGTPRANLADFLEGQPADVVADLRELATAWQATFCGDCGASPESPTPRCSACRARLDELLRARSNDELRRLEQLVRTGVI